MLAKRIISLILGFAAAIVLILFTNAFVINTVISVFIVMALTEFGKAFNNKNIKPITIVNYYTVLAMYAITTLSYTQIIAQNVADVLLYLTVPVAIISLFIYYVFQHHKYTIIDVGITLLQLIYCVLMFNYIPKVYAIENGKLILWYVFIGSWFTDIFAFCIGKAFGKHKFTSISPNKSIEGCIAGVVGCVLSLLAFTWYLNSYQGMQISYIYMFIFSIVCSIVSQVGDLFASSIKRYTEIKDYGNVFPGHGGIIDRFDSTLFVAPLVYMFFTVFM